MEEATPATVLTRYQDWKLVFKAKVFIDRGRPESRPLEGLGLS
jgi:hypothetical protein